MKTLILAVALSVMSINAYSENATYNDETGMLHIPVVNFHGAPTYSDAEFRLRDDGLWELIRASSYQGRIFPYTENNFTFNSQSIGGMFTLSDGSLWTITGVTSGGLPYSGGGTHTLSIYHGTSSLLEPMYGSKSDYFMIIDGQGQTIFVDPI